MAFCYSPWANIDFSPTGDISPCCKFQTKHYSQKYNIQHNSIQEYSNSDFLKQIKKDFTTDVWPIGCERCVIEESNNIKSKRQLDFDRWGNEYKTYELSDNNFITASIAFGNTCNLKCITCNPHASSKWREEYKEIYNISIEHHKFYKQNFVNDFVTVTPNIIHIDIPGGEPFLSGVREQQELLKFYIEADQAKFISLHYTTNATVFPESTWWELWKHFKEIDLQLSIDGIGKRYEYIRYPANWDEVTVNIDQYLTKQSLDNFRLSLSHTVSAFNIYYLDEFFTWCYNKELPTPWLGRVHTPVHMTPEVWPREVREYISNHLLESNHADILNWATLLSNLDNTVHFEKFCLKVKQHDLYRKTNFAEVFPEMSKSLL
jgi:hypothetical protein